MVGRRGELAELRRLLDEAAEAGSPATALVVGEAGVGKSRLLDELVGVGGRPVALVGHARDEGGAAPFSVVRDVVVAEVADWDGLPATLASLAHPLAHLLAPWLPVVEHPDDGHEHAADELALAAVELIRFLVGGGPAVVAFEDVHWADAESLLVVRRLAAAQRLPALVVVTLRPEDFERGDLLAGLLGDLDRRRASHVTLEPLTRSELRELLSAMTGATVSGAVTDLVHERTQGNPFFVEELIAAASGEGVGAVSEGEVRAAVDAPLPWSAVAMVTRRVDGLAAETRRVLEVAAVLGHRFAFGLLQVVAGRDEEAVATAAAELIAKGVLVEGAADELAFRHALTREAVRRRLLFRRRQIIHARALAALRDAPDADPHLLAVHADGAADGDAARRYARQAAERALRTGAPRSAARLARMGLAHGEDLALHAILARACAEIGDMPDAQAHAQRWAVAAAACDDAAQESAAQRLLAWVRWSCGDRAGAWQALQAAEHLAHASGAPADQGWAAAVRAQLLALGGQAQEAIVHADRAMALAEGLDDRRLGAHAMATKGVAVLDASADTRAGRIEEAVALLDRARADAEEIGDVHTLTRALNNRLVPTQGATSVAESRVLLADAHRVVDRYGAERFAAKLATIEAYAAMLDGDADAARAALATAHQPYVPIDAYFRVALEALLEAETGDPEQARRLLAEHRPALDGLQAEAHVDFALAEAAVAAATADADSARAALSRAGAVVGHVPAGSAVTWWDVAVCAVHAGVTCEAVEQARRHHAPAEGLRSGAATAHLDGLMAAARGHTEEAIAAYRRAAAGPTDSRPAALTADAHSRLAELLAQTGEMPAARRHAATATELLARWPGWRRDAAQALRRRLGDDDHPPHELLTPREHEVCVLLARGLSNGQIAKELFISPKTAAVHVSNILAKTGLQRRAQVAAWALHSGLVDADR